MAETPNEFTLWRLGPSPVRTVAISRVDNEALATLVVPMGSTLYGISEPADWHLGRQWIYLLPSPVGGATGIDFDIAQFPNADAAKAQLAHIHDFRSISPWLFDVTMSADAAYVRTESVAVQVNNVALSVWHPGQTREQMRALGEQLTQELESGGTFATREPVGLSAAAVGLATSLATSAPLAERDLMTKLDAAALATSVLPAEAKPAFTKQAGPDWVMDNQVAYEAVIYSDWVKGLVTIETKVAKSNEAATEALLRLWDASRTKPAISAEVAGDRGFAEPGMLAMQVGNVVVRLTWPRKPVEDLKALGATLMQAITVQAEAAAAGAETVAEE